MGLHSPGGEFGKDPLEGLAAQSIASNGMHALGDSVGLKGTLAFRRLNSTGWLLKRTKTSKDVPEDATLESLNLDSITSGTAVPINTVVKELPDRRKSDLIAVCVADGSNEAVVIRAQVKMGRIKQKWGDDAKQLVDSWDSGEKMSARECL